MRRPSGGTVVLLAALVAAGCQGKPKPVPVVWVDLDRIPTRAEAPWPEPPLPPQPLAGTTVTVPSLPRREVRTTADRTLEQIRRDVEQDIARAARQLESRLARIYTNEVRAQEAELLAPLRELTDQLIREAFAEMAARFQVYAEARGNLVPQITIRTRNGDPLAPIPEPSSESIPVRRRFEEAVALRQRLVELDAAWRTEADALLADAQRRLQDREAELRADFARKLLEAQDRAAREAREQVDRSRRTLGIDPSSSGRLVLPAEPGATLRLPGGKPIAPAPGPPVESTARIRPREALEADLRIWLGLTGYKLERGGEDRTQEFLRWRQAQSVGP